MRGSAFFLVLVFSTSVWALTLAPDATPEEAACALENWNRRNLGQKPLKCSEILKSTDPDVVCFNEPSEYANSELGLPKPYCVRRPKVSKQVVNFFETKSEDSQDKKIPDVVGNQVRVSQEDVPIDNVPADDALVNTVPAEILKRRVVFSLHDSQRVIVGSGRSVKCQMQDLSYNGQEAVSSETSASTGVRYLMFSITIDGMKFLVNPGDQIKFKNGTIGTVVDDADEQRFILNFDRDAASNSTGSGELESRHAYGDLK